MRLPFLFNLDLYCQLLGGILGRKRIVFVVIKEIWVAVLDFKNVSITYIFLD